MPSGYAMSGTRDSSSVEEVQRVAWTDERLDDLAGRMDAGFTHVSGEIRELRTEIGVLRTELRTESRDLRADLEADIKGLRTELKGDIDALRSVVFRFGIAIMACLVGAVVTGSMG